MVKTVIDLANELLLTSGKEDAIRFFNERINSITPPKNFQEVCKIAGAETAIKYINNITNDK